MTKKQTKELKQKLEKEKESLERELKAFAKKDTKPSGDWDTQYPKFDSGNLDLAAEADEVQEYENLLPIEHSLELRLRDVDLALEKMGKGLYGKCEKCGKKIDTKRLDVCPEAKLCVKCNAF